MGFIMELFFPTPKISQNYKFGDNTTKQLGAPLTTIYGRANVKGNAVYKKNSDNDKYRYEVLALCWGPVNFETSTIRVNEKRPHYINGSLNPNRKKSPGYIANTKVWMHNGRLGQSMNSEFKEDYGFNRTCVAYIEAKANSDLSSINDFEVVVERPNLFTTSGMSGDYNTPIPTAIKNAFPNGIRPSNNFAAALDYMLNRDYGASIDEAEFKDFSTWIAAINYADVAVNSSDSTSIPWLAIDGFSKVNKTELKRTKGGRGWNATAYSSDGASALLNFDVEFIAKPFSSNSYQTSVRECYTIDKDTFICENVTRTTVFTQNAICGLAAKDQRTDPENFDFSFRLENNGKAYIYESGIRKYTIGSYISGDAFKITWDQSTVKYYHKGSLVYTSSKTVDEKTYMSVASYSSGGQIKIGSWSESVGNYRYAYNAELGTDKEDDHIDAIKKLMTACHGAPFQSNGMLKVWYAHPTATSAWLDRSTFETKGADMMDVTKIPNVIEIEYQDPDDRSEKRTTTWEDPASIDRWREIREDQSVGGISTRNEGSRYANFIGRRGIAERMKIKGEADQRYFTLEPGDVIELTYGSEDNTWFTNKKFWIDEVTPSNRNGDVDLILLEYGGDSLFDDSAATTIEVDDPVYAKDETISMANPGSVPKSPTLTGYEIDVVEKKPTRLFHADIFIQEPDQASYMHDTYRIYRKTKPTDVWKFFETVPGHANSFRDSTGKFDTETYMYAITSVTKFQVESELPTGDDVALFILPLNLDIPDPVANLVVQERLDRRHDITFNYNDPPIDFDSFVVYGCPGSVFSEATKFLIKDDYKNTSLRTDAFQTIGDYTVAVFAKDTFDNLSPIAQYSFSLAALPPPTNLRVTELVGGVQLSWDEADTAITVFYDVFDGDTFETATLFAGMHRSTTIFIPLNDASDHTFYVRTTDAYGNPSIEAVQISASVVAPNNVTDFNVVAQDDSIFGSWTELTGYGVIGIIYEIREGQIWETANLVARVTGNSFKMLWPEDGSFNFLIKASSPAKLYSPTAAFTTSLSAKLQNRDLVFEEDFFVSGWPGVKHNVSVTNLSGENVLRLDKSAGTNKPFGYYAHDVNLGEYLYCRNWLKTRAGTEVTDTDTWADATYTWDDPQALQSWLPINELDSANARRLIATKLKVSDLSSDLIDGWNLNGSTTSLRGLTPVISVNEAFADGRYTKGHYSNDSVLYYDVSGSKQGTWIQDWKPTVTPTQNVYLGLYGDQADNWIRIIYYPASEILRLYHSGVGEDGTYCDIQNVTIEAGKNYRIAAVHTATQRTLMIYNSGFGVLSKTITALPLTVVPNRIYAQYNASVQVEVGVIGNVELRTNEMTIVEFTADCANGYPTPVGYSEFTSLIPGDYAYEDAIVVLHLQPSSDLDDFYITNGKLTVDVPEIIDKGTETVSATGWTTVNYNKNFSSIAVVNALQKTGTEIGIAEIDDASITKTSFNVRLIAISTQTQISGTISWTSIGR